MKDGLNFVPSKQLRRLADRALGAFVFHVEHWLCKKFIARWAAALSCCKERLDLMGRTMAIRVCWHVALPGYQAVKSAQELSRRLVFRLPTKAGTLNVEWQAGIKRAQGGLK